MILQSILTLAVILSLIPLVWRQKQYIFLPAVIFGLIYTISCFIDSQNIKSFVEVTLYDPVCEKKDYLCVNDDETTDKRGYTCSHLPWDQGDDDMTGYENCFGNDTPTFTA